MFARITLPLFVFVSTLSSRNFYSFFYCYIYVLVPWVTWAPHVCYFRFQCTKMCSHYYIIVYVKICTLYIYIYIYIYTYIYIYIYIYIYCR